MTELFCHLRNRGTVRIGGEDRRAFLQGLISNDIHLCVGDKMLYAALLTPQGKFLHDLFIVDGGDYFLVDCELARADDLVQRLQRYKLRSKISIENVSGNFDLWVQWNSSTQFYNEGRTNFSPLEGEARRGGAPQSQFLEKGIAPSPNPSLKGRGALPPCFIYSDPRIPALGSRAFLQKGETLEGKIVSFAEYDKHRLSLGVPDGSRDMIVEKSTLSDGNFDLLNGISWSKGCYLGQELTARMHYRALVKKRMFPVRIDYGLSNLVPTERQNPLLLAGRGTLASLPAFDALKSKTIYLNGEEIGEMRSSCEDMGLALLNLEKAKDAFTTATILTCNSSQLKILEFLEQ